VNHGQFQMRVGVVERQAGIFSQQNHQQGGCYQQQDCIRGPSHAARPSLARQHTQRKSFHAGRYGQQTDQQGHFSQGRKLHLAAGTHALKSRSGIEGRQHGDKTHQPQRVHHQQQIAGKSQQGRGRSKRRQHERQKNGGQGDARPGPEDPRGGPAINGAFAQQLEKIVIELQQRRSSASPEKGLDPVDHTRQQRGEGQGEQDMQKRVAHEDHRIRLRRRVRC